MDSIIFIAPPAAGKGTLSSKIKKQFNLPHISTGDLLREEASSNTPYAQELKAVMKSGRLISDNIILEILAKRIAKSDCDNGYILDGFPRNLAQAKAYEDILDKLNKTLGKVIYISVDKDIAKKRILGRASCPSCKAVYNEYIEGSMPKINGICDRCGDHLVKRSDDNQETFDVRFDTYIENTEPLIQHYDELKVLYRISNNENSELAFKEIEKIIAGGN